jgi:hypothetical protein
MGYNPIEDFQRKDLLESGDPDKIVRGTELQVEFDAISADLAKVRVEQGNLNYLPITGGTVNGDISARKITATEFVGGTLSATNVSGTTFAGNGAALTGMKMSQLTDVKMTNVARDDVLIWNGSAWEASDVYDIVSPLTYAGILDVTQPAPTANNGDVFVNDQEGEAHPSFKGIAGVLILEGKFVIYDAPTDEWNSPGNSADGGVNIVKAGSGIEVDSIKPSEPVVSIDRTETDTWYLASDAETSKWETVTGGIAYNNGNVGFGETNPTRNIDVRDATNASMALKVTGSSQFSFINDGTTGDIGVTNSKNLTFSTGSNGDVERMRIDASGTTTVTGGFMAAKSDAGAGAIAIGLESGNTTQGVDGVAIGRKSGQTSQGAYAIAVGRDAGLQDQDENAVAIGVNAGKGYQGNSGVAIGNGSGFSNQSDYGTAVGVLAGETDQAESAVAVGDQAGRTTQGVSAVAIGRLAGQTSQGTRAIAIGNGAGISGQLVEAIAIGRDAGTLNQQANSIAIGTKAGEANQGANGIIINSSGATENATQPNHILLKSGASKYLYYNGTNSWEFQGGDLVCSGNVTAYSDERLKSDVETLDGSKVYDMRGVSFTKDGEAGSGVIAQELQKVAPELVLEGEEYLSVAYGNLVGYLIEAVKDLKAEVEELKRAK